jgi:hypothetical protein
LVEGGNSSNSRYFTCGTLDRSLKCCQISLYAKNSRYFTCGTLDRSLKFAKSRFTHKIIIIILNRFFLVENVKANMKSRVQCEKQTLVRVQSRKNVKLVPGHVKLVPGHVKLVWTRFSKMFQNSQMMSGNV